MGKMMKTLALGDREYVVAGTAALSHTRLNAEAEIQDMADKATEVALDLSAVAVIGVALGSSTPMIATMMGLSFILPPLI